MWGAPCIRPSGFQTSHWTTILCKLRRYGGTQPEIGDVLCFSDREVQIFSQFSTQFDGAVKNLAKMASDQTTKCQNHYKREFSNIGKCFTGLGQAMEQDGGGYNNVSKDY